MGSLISSRIRRAMLSLGMLALLATALRAQTSITVTTTLDVVDGTVTSVAALAGGMGADGKISLREAVLAANNEAGTGAIIIGLPAGTYILTIPGTAEAFTGNAAIGDLDITRTNVMLTGSGAGVTTIRQNSALDDRIIEANPNQVAAFTFMLSNVTLENGRTPDGGGALVCGSTGNVTVVTNCAFTSNQTTAVGAFGGAVANIGGGSLTMSNCTFTTNTAVGTSGGAVGFDSPDNGTLAITGSTFSGNVSSNAVNNGGGAIAVLSGTASIATSSFTSNSVTTNNGKGGALYVGFTQNAVAMKYSRLLNNSTIAIPNGPAVYSRTASITVDDNWWGQNSGPISSSVIGAAASSWLQFRLAASVNPILGGNTSVITADVLGRSSGAALPDTALAAMPVLTCSADSIKAGMGSLSSPAIELRGGKGTVTYTAPATSGGFGFASTFDNQLRTLLLNVQNSSVSVANGNWDSPSTWSPASIPGAAHVVTIGHTVALTADASARDLTTTAGGTVNLGTATLNVAGNWVGAGAVSGTGTVVFNGAGAQAITKTGGETFPNLTVNKSAGTLTLNNNVTVSTAAALTSGVVQTGSNALIIGASSAGALTIENGTVTGKVTRAIASGATSTYAFTNQFTQLTPDGSQGAATVSVTSLPNTDAPNDASLLAVKRYYTVTASAPLTAAVRLAYDTAELRSGQDENTLTLWSSTASTWANKGQSSRDAAANWVEMTGISQWGDLTLAMNSSALPVELTTFTAASSRMNVQLKWATATEVNNAGFDIERAAAAAEGSAKQWTKVGFADGHGTTNAPNTYAFTDKTPASGTYAYRLKQIDRDGAFTYSREIETESGIAPKEFMLSQNYPNPFNPTTAIEFTLAVTGKATMTVYNTAGQEVAVLFDAVAEAGRYQRATFDGKNFSSGTYFVRLASGGSQLMRKMLLVK